MFIPKRIIFEKNSREYEIGNNIYNFFKGNENVETIQLSSNRIKENIPGESLYNFYREGKKTLVVGIKRGLKFQSCKPSAHYQLPLVSGCIGQCQYCYLNTNLGERPYTRINVNLDDIFAQVKKYITERLPAETIFEGSATSDPIPTEPYANTLKHAIDFFNNSPNGRFRFVTKFTDIDTLLGLDHGGHTEIRFTLNTNKVITDYESGAPSLNRRIEACQKIITTGYPMGFIIAPVFLYDNWKEDYRDLLLALNKSLPEDVLHPITFEVISHRYTTRAKNIISEVFPNTKLPMNDEARKYKYGQFGYGKFVYNQPEQEEIKTFFNNEIESIFKNKIIKYII